MVKMELVRAFISRSFLLALVIGLLSLVYGLADYASGPDPKDIPGASPFLNNAFDAFVWAENSLFALIAPLIAVLPFSDSFVLDRTYGYLNFILARSSYRKYLISKFLANLLSGGISLAIPLILIYIYTNIYYPRGFPSLVEARIPYDPMPGPLGQLYRHNPDMYILFLVGLAFVFGSVYATLALAISSLVHNRYVVLSSPFLLYMVASFILAVLQMEIWSPPATLTPHSLNSTSWITVFGELGGIFLISSVVLLIVARKERIYG